MDGELTVVARYRIEHTSIYEYDRNVSASYNEARLTPLQTPWQIRLDSAIAIEPVSWTHGYTDYWGTDVRVFEANSPHRTLEVRASSLVEVDPSRRPAAEPVGWDELREPAVVDRHIEYLTQTESTAPPLELADLAASLAADNAPEQAVQAVCEAVHNTVTYAQGATAVHTTAAEAWAERRGVCQDLAHLVVGALRSVGVPARYVSGYLHPSADPLTGESAVGESHAWVEAWLGEWTPFDPTNLADVAERHVMIGSGRDYGDVPPIKGIVAGDHESAALTVTVELRRLA